MQNPHCAAPVSRNAAWSALRPVVPGQPLDRRHVPAVGLGGEHEARVHAPAVDQHGARAALPDEAALLRPGEPEVVAQGVEQRVVPGHRDGPRTPVEREPDRDAVAHARAARGQAPDRLRDRAPAEDPEHRQPVLGARAHRRGRRRGAGEQPVEHVSPGTSSVASGSARTPLSSTDQQGPRPDAAVGEARDPVPPDRAGQGDRGQVVAAPPGPPDVRGAAAARRGSAARSRSGARPGRGSSRRSGPTGRRRGCAACRRAPATTRTAP